MITKRITDYKTPDLLESIQEDHPSVVQLTYAVRYQHEVYERDLHNGYSIDADGDDSLENGIDELKHSNAEDIEVSYSDPTKPLLPAQVEVAIEAYLTALNQRPTYIWLQRNEKYDVIHLVCYDKTYSLKFKVFTIDNMVEDYKYTPDQLRLIGIPD